MLEEEDGNAPTQGTPHPCSNRLSQASPRFAAIVDLWIPGNHFKAIVDLAGSELRHLFHHRRPSLSGLLLVNLLSSIAIPDLVSSVDRFREQVGLAVEVDDFRDVVHSLPSSTHSALSTVSGKVPRAVRSGVSPMASRVCGECHRRGRRPKESLSIHPLAAPRTSEHPT